MKTKFILVALLAAYGLLQSALTTLAQPTATTLAATSIGPNNATLNGTVNPNGATAAGYFQYGLTTNYGNIGGFLALPATNTAQALPGVVVNALQGPAGATWTLSGTPSFQFQSVASSADGTRLTAGLNNGGIYVSTDGGSTWTLTSAPTGVWVSIASSADGTRLAAATTQTSSIYVSTNNGATWTLTSAAGGTWTSIASSADGTRLAAGTQNARVYTSTNGGVTWTQTSAPIDHWYSIASSIDGIRLAAAAVDYIYTSTNGGATWTQTSATNSQWSSIASSADGLRLVAANGHNGIIYASTNGGITWAATSAPVYGWVAVASSADGARLAAVIPTVGTLNDGAAYYSTNSGLTWISSISASNIVWSSIAMSADGSKLAGAAYGIYISSGPVSPLTQGTTYHYRAVGVNSLGKGLGADMTFTTLAPPAVTTFPATSITSTNATLNGTVNPDGAATTAYFRYGLTTSYGSFSGTNALAATNLTLSVSNLVGNFTPGTTYHFQLVASNSVGTALGADLSLTTLAQPAVTTLAATSIATTNAVLNGTVNPNLAATSAYFRYGLTTSYGSYSATNSLPATNVILSVSNLIGNLTPGGTTYHFQLVAGNSVGTSLGNDLTFTTAVVAPAPTTLAASSITTTNATLNGTVNPNGAATTAYFQYGLTTNYGSYSATNALAATNASLSVSNLIINLTPGGAAYHFRLVAGNSMGTSLGNDLTFTTTAVAPAPATFAASSITATNALLNGTVNPDGAVTTAYFRYGLTTSYGSYSATNALAATNATLSVSNLIGNLALGTSYHFQLVASNSAGLVVGGDVVFTTQPLPPVVTTLAATSVSTNATLNGSVNPNRGITTAYFQYGLTTSYGYVGGYRTLPATNVAQTLPGQVVNALTGAAGANWTSTATPAVAWTATASSADGTRMAAASGGTGGVYVSTDGGVTWTQTSLGSGSWNTLACSADFSRLAVGAYNGNISYSPDGGTTWLPSDAPGSTIWSSIAASADGMLMVAAAQGGGIYRSTDGGTTWTPTAAPAAQWQCIASSAAGNRLVAGIASGAALGGIYVSTNSGATWTQTSTNNTYSWKAMACSADGLKLVAGELNSAWTSTDGGVTWTQTSLSTGGALNALSSSADGVRLAAASNTGLFYSQDGGSTWTQGSVPSHQWLSMASSADGSKLVSGAYGGGGVVFTSTGPIANLAPGTTYHFRAVGLNSAGTGLGTDLSFTTSAGAPSPATLSASGITTTNATLNGSVNPNGAATSAWFRYGLTTNYGSYSATNNFPATNVTLSVSSLVNSLTPGASYHFQLVAGNSQGVTTGADLTLTTFGVPAYGYGQAILADHPMGYWRLDETNGVIAHDYYRMNDGGYTNAFLGQPGNPVVDTHTAAGFVSVGGNNSLVSAVTNDFASGIINAEFSVECWAKGGPQAAGAGIISKGVGNGGEQFVLDCGSVNNGFRFYVQDGAFAYHAANGTLTPDNNWHHLVGVCDEVHGLVILYVDGVSNVSATITPGSGLAPTAAFTTFGARSSDALHYSYGVYDLQFTGSMEEVAIYNYALTAAQAHAHFLSASNRAPTAVTLAASGITSTNSTLNGTVNPNGASSAAYFRYGLTTSYGSYTATNLLTATNSALPVSGLINGLTPGTAYHFQLVASNSLGASLGSDLTFTTGAGVPTATTLSASGITATNATLNGTVNPDGGATSAYFSYGLTTNYGSYSATNSLLATNATLSVSNLISSLAPGATYHFQLVASNSAGTNAGADFTFTTSVAAPLATTLAASGITATNALLNGTINPNGAATTAWFRYGLTTSYGNYSATNSLPATNVALSVSNLISSLTPGTTYHFQLIASNSVGTNAGADLTFTASPVSPTPTTLAASSINSTNATLNGTVNPNGASTKSYFRYGLTTGYGSYTATNTLAGTNVTLSVSNLISSLTPGTTYHFQLVAGNSAGTNTGVDMQFTTSPAMPTATTLAASGISSSSATLNGTVKPNGAVTAAYFRFGLTTNYGSYSATNNLTATNVTLSVSNLVGSLTPGATYHFELVAGNSFGTNSGADLTFTTGALAPTVTTLAAGSITASNAILDGSVNPNGAATAAYFRYGLTTNHGSYSATNNLAATNTTLSISNLISSLTPGATYHFQLVAGNSAGTNAGADVQFTTQSQAAQAVNFSLNEPVRLPGGAFQFSFTNLSGLSFTVLGTTNLALPASNWTVLGATVEGPAGHYQFTDPQATNSTTRYYRVRSP
jgi:6,7-dimethyl-8-ribityllumazine synthase